MLPRSFIGPKFEALSTRAREQLSGQIFDKMAKLFKRGERTLGVRIGKRDYRVSEAESGQFSHLVQAVGEVFQRQHRGAETAEGMHIMGLAADDGSLDDILIVYFSHGIRVGPALGGEALARLPEMFRRPMMIVGHVLVDYVANQLVVHFQEISGTGVDATRAASAAALDFAGRFGCVVRMDPCRGCGELLPILKKCSICDAGFCDAHCLKAAWPRHKAECKPRSDEDAKTDKRACALVAAERRIGCPCGNPVAGNLKCGRCKVQTYCSRSCQVACWAFHRAACQRC